MSDRADIAVVGLGAAGLMAAIWAGRSASGRLRVVGLDGAARLGAKILVAGGGRCNVTHFEVSERDYAGASPHAIKKVLRSFDVAATTAFFRELGVSLKREETGKLFPTTDKAATVLDALLGAARSAGVELRHPARVERIDVAPGEGDPPSHRFAITGPWGHLRASRVILATGGMALPKTGSDGQGYQMARSLGHTITPAVFPALVPLRVEAGWFLTECSGVSALATVEVWSATGKRLVAFTDAVLCTHFGLSGPAILNVSRHLEAARRADLGAWLSLNWMPGVEAGALDSALVGAKSTRVGRVVAELSPGEGLPVRLVEALVAHAGVAPESPAGALTREKRRGVVEALTRLRVPVTGDRGYTFAEATAGGVPLTEVKLDTMESRVCPGLHLCGEILDVDGRIGGFNFQWAWASGWLAGRGATSQVLSPES